MRLSIGFSFIIIHKTTRASYFFATFTSLFNISFHSSLIFCDSNLRSIPPPLLKLTVKQHTLSASVIDLDFTGGPATTLVTYC